jgi:hypothetical protein
MDPMSEYPAANRLPIRQSYQINEVSIHHHQGHRALHDFLFGAKAKSLRKIGRTSESIPSP